MSGSGTVVMGLRVGHRKGINDRNCGYRAEGPAQRGDQGTRIVVTMHKEENRGMGGYGILWLWSKGRR